MVRTPSWFLAGYFGNAIIEHCVPYKRDSSKAIALRLPVFDRATSHNEAIAVRCLTNSLRPRSLMRYPRRDGMLGERSTLPLSYTRGT